VEDVKKAAIDCKRTAFTVEDLKSAIERSLLPQERLDGLHWIFHQRGWKIMKTVPYHPETQPIESLWARIKKDVAKKFRADRTVSQVMGQTHEAFKLTTPDFIGKIVRKAAGAVVAHVKSYRSKSCATK